MLVWTPEADTEAVRTIQSLLSKENSKDIQRARRRQERVGIAGGGTGECCGPVVIRWHWNWLPAKRSHDVRNNKDQVRVSEVDLHSSAKVPNETE
jgi:hypothetical protein